MPQMDRERRLAPAPSDKSSLVQMHRSTTGVSEDQDFLPRFGFRTYPEVAHQRARQERDRRLGKETISQPIIDLDDDSDDQHVCDATCRHLGDREWFATHPLARSRMRNSLAGEEGARVLVTLKGKRTIEKTYFGGTA